ncbi:MAG: tRNA epoxyqueuosine(34) reductase QueG [Deltaproteobacteria bacterium]|nr:tRNA epoxyqueuosine(34) reductase QueG [Deltaproteobacteria bacterium]
MGQEISLKIEALAFELGFSQVAWAPLEKNSQAAKRFKQWLEASYQGEMSYLERGLEKREDPEKILPGAKSILCLSWGYSKKKQLKGKIESPFISRYAWQEDYHLILQKKLNLLQKQLEQYFPQAQFRSYVDTGQVMEKHWASQAGLGWIGKHSNLIHPKQGSYFFLASILTDLPSDSLAGPVSDHCGNCQACIDICPTRAIVAPYMVDARLCISYLTIELKGPIPRELRPQIGAHVFGCDDCQEVCPWNRKAKLPLDFLRSASVEELHFYLKLDAQAFKKYFKELPMLRPKRRGFLRNVCVVLGNLKKRESVPLLIQALQDEEALIRGHAVWALGQYADLEIQKELEKTLQKETDLWVREEICQILKK